MLHGVDVHARYGYKLPGMSWQQATDERALEEHKRLWDAIGKND